MNRDKVVGSTPTKKPRKKNMSEIIHLCNYASQPSIQIACDGSWTEPAWDERSGLTDIEGVYRSDDNRLYTFVEEKTTCPHCIKKEKLA
jgi:hypothetical protein